MFNPQLITGNSVSVTVMVCTHDLVLPAPSVAVHVMVVVPMGYNALSARLSLRTPVSEGVPQLSVAVGALTWRMAPQLDGSAFREIFAEQIMMGSSVSETLIAWLHEAVLPDASVAVHVMMVVPVGYMSLRSCPSLRTPVTVTPEQLSVATGTAL
jgi:hypothetical protein